MSQLASKLEFEPLLAPPERWQGGNQIGPYTLLVPLASGGMGEVWLARVQGPKGFEKLAAIKRMSSELSRDPDFVEMFADEARLAARLSHPNVVQTYEFNELRGVFYLVMEYLHGESLDTAMRKLEAEGKSLPINLAVAIAADAAQGLEHAHGRVGDDGTPLGIVHRDISPQNLFITYDGQVKVVDFGVAKAKLQRRVTQVGQVKGKAGYIAPEQLLGETVDGRADQFALAGVLFEMLTGTRLIPLQDREGRVARLIRGEEQLPKVRDRRPELPEELAWIVDRGLQRQPDARFTTMAAFGQALRDWLLLQESSHPQEMGRLMRSLFAEQLRAKEKLMAMGAPKRAGLPAPISLKDRLRDRSLYHELSRTFIRPRKGARYAAVALGGLLAASLGALALRSRPHESLAPSPEAVPTLGSTQAAAPAAPPAPTRADLAAPSTSSPQAPEVVPVTPRPRRKPAMARLTLQTIPWSIAYEGDRRLGETPLVGLELPAGTHQLKLVREEQGGGTIVVEVTLKPGQHKVMRLRL